MLSKKRRKRGRPFGKSLNSIFFKNIYVKLQCTKCKFIYNIRINPGNEPLYTEEYKTNYICLLCRYEEKKNEELKKDLRRFINIVNELDELLNSSSRIKIPKKHKSKKEKK